jgi:DMSO reductase family type II enzyme chaperone
VFGNYKTSSDNDGRDAQRIEPAASDLTAPSKILGWTTRVGLQEKIDSSVARAFIYGFLARSYADPEDETWTWFTDRQTLRTLQSGVAALEADSGSLEKAAIELVEQLRTGSFEEFQIAYVTAFGHAARGSCPLNEIEYRDVNADPLFQPHRLADLAAFYRAFGLEVAEDAAERPDHIGMELEFMSVLSAKEAHGYEHRWDDEQFALCKDAQKKFLREHLGRWCPGFARRLARAAKNRVLAALAEFTCNLVVADCARFGVTPGSGDLSLRPVDQAAEALCASCGLQNALPEVVPSPGRV